MTAKTSTSWPLFHLPTEINASDSKPLHADSSDHSPSTAFNLSEISEIGKDKATKRYLSSYLENFNRWPQAPPWRRFLDPDQLRHQRVADAKRWIKLLRIQDIDSGTQRRGEHFRLGADPQSEALLQAVNAAIHLRRPLLVRGEPGTGKTSLAYALAHRLGLGPVLHWRITSRSRLVDGLYRYDALGMLQDLQRDDFLLRRQAQGLPAAEQGATAPPMPAERQMADYISLGPVGTAFLPSLLPRVLLIDEIDKADPQLPNELLHLFEEGEFDIPELTRERRHQRLQDPDAALDPWDLATADLDPIDLGGSIPVEAGRIEPLRVQVDRVPVLCCQFPIVVMTSNDERDFSPAFKRRCLRISMPYPNEAQLMTILRSHFNRLGQDFWTDHKAELAKLIEDFIETDNKDRHDRATDQLLNYLHLFSEDPQFRPTDQALEQLKSILLRRLGSSEDRM
jgi:MoxR-like ATPase